MLTIYVADQQKLTKADNVLKSKLLPRKTVWVDMLRPTSREENMVEGALNIDVPTHEDMRGIEVSNRLYKEGKALFMTANIIAGSDTDTPESRPVTFILADHKLITVRYHDPKAFDMFASRARKTLEDCGDGESALITLLDTIVDRLSDPLESIALQVDKLSRDVFHPKEAGAKKTDFNALLRAIGQKGDLNSMVKESLVSLDRLLSFLSFHIQPENGVTKGLKNDLKSIEQDIRAMAEHAAFLSGKMNFLLDAALGMISIEQNSIIKFFSVAAVIFLPPTLIASIYGMNFAHMPELQWAWSYPVVLGVMFMSAILPYLYFKHRRWL